MRQPVLILAVTLALMTTAGRLGADERDDRIRALMAEGDRLSDVANYRFKEAHQHYEEADRLAADSADASLRAHARLKLAQVLLNLEQVGRSVEVARQAAAMARDAGALGLAGNALRTVGSGLIALARFDEAERVLKEAADLSSAHGTADEAARALNNLGVAAQYQGRLAEALDYARHALASVDRALANSEYVSPRMHFAGPFNVGKILADSGDYDGSRQYLDRAFAAAEKFQDVGGQMHVLFDTGEWYEAQGDFYRAERYYRRSAEFTSAHGSNEGAGKSYRGLGRVSFATGRLEDAVKHLTEAVRRFEQGQQMFPLAPALVELARARAAIGQDDEAARDLDRAIAISGPQNHFTAQVLARIERGRQATRAGRFAAARSDFESAIALAGRVRLLPLVPAAWAGLAALSEAQGDLGDALASYERAANALDGIRGRIVSLDLRVNFAAATHATFAGLERVLMGLHAIDPNGGYGERAFVALERERSQALGFALLEARATATDEGTPTTERRIAQIQNALFAPDLEAARRDVLLASLDDAERDLTLTVNRRDGTHPAAGRSLPVLANLQRALGATDIVLEYTASAAFVVTSAHLRIVPLDMPGDLEARIAFFVGALESESRDAAVAAGQVLTTRLLDPVRPWVPAGARILVVSSGPLARLPLGALPVTNDRGQVVPFLARHEVSYLPSLTIFADRRAAAGGVLERTLLAVADPRSLSEEARALAPLPGSRAEVRFLSRLMTGAQVLMAGGATEQAVKHAAGDAAIVHLATHALLDPGVPERSAVLLGRSKDDDGLLQSREIYQLPLRGSLVVLSGCRTAAGRLSAAEGLHSLARAFLHAGGRTVIGGLWDLPDRAASDMMRRFYTGLDAGHEAGSALREAQLALAGDDPYGTSRAWAAVVMMGDPSVTLTSGQTSLVGWAPMAVVGAMLVWMAARRRGATRASDRP